MEFNSEYFFRERKLRRISPDLEKAKSSLNISDLKIEEARKLYSSEFFPQSVLSAYTSMFHSARAILYFDGVQEKSHYAVYIYLKDKYSKKIPMHMLNSFIRYQNLRKEILYGFEENSTNKDDAENAILTAEELLSIIKKLLIQHD